MNPDDINELRETIEKFKSIEEFDPRGMLNIIYLVPKLKHRWLTHYTDAEIINACTDIMYY